MRAVMLPVLGILWVAPGAARAQGIEVHTWDLVRGPAVSISGSLLS